MAVFRATTSGLGMFREIAKFSTDGGGGVGVSYWTTFCDVFLGLGLRS